MNVLRMRARANRYLHEVGRQERDLAMCKHVERDAASPNICCPPCNSTRASAQEQHARPWKRARGKNRGVCGAGSYVALRLPASAHACICCTGAEQPAGHRKARPRAAACIMAMRACSTAEVALGTGFGSSEGRGAGSLVDHVVAILKNLHNHKNGARAAARQQAHPHTRTDTLARTLPDAAAHSMTAGHDRASAAARRHATAAAITCTATAAVAAAAAPAKPRRGGRGTGLGCGMREHLGCAEVGELEEPIGRQQEVLRLYVSVDQLVFVHILDTCSPHRPRDEPRAHRWIACRKSGARKEACRGWRHQQESRSWGAG